ncbi:hypothetical protein ACHWQZ_G011949 [Mnemiopsis leidyi]
MDEHHTGEGYSETLHEGYGVVPSNSEYNQSFRSVIASAPPVLQTETSVYDALSAQNLIQVRKQKKRNQHDSDPMEIRVRKLKQVSPRIQQAVQKPLPQQAVVITRKKPPIKHENVILPALSRRRRSFEQKNLPSVPEIEKKTKVLPAIESNSPVPDIDVSCSPSDDVMHFIKAIKYQRGEEVIGELNHLHSQRLAAMNKNAAKYGVRNDDIVLKSLLKHDSPKDMSIVIGKDDFIYGICRGACSYYNPYDLRRVKRAAIPPNAIFYTITHDNVMMVSPFNGEDNTVTGIDAWLRERTIFLKIVKMRTFQQFRLWKAFKHWMRGCSSRRHEERGTSLYRSLFTLDHVMRSVLLRVQDYCETASHSCQDTVNIAINGNYENNDAIKLIAIDIEKTYSLEGYIKFQAEAINTAKEDLLRLRSNVLELASGVCHEMGAAAGMQSQYKEQIRESKRALKEKAELEARHALLEKMFGNKEYYPDVVMLENKKFERKKQLRDVNLPTYTDIQQWKKVIYQLSRFLRLIDCLLLTLLRRLCGRAIKLLKDHLNLAMESGAKLKVWVTETEKVTKENRDRKQILKMRKIRERKERLLEGILADEEEEEVEDPNFVALALPAKPNVLPPLLDITLVLTEKYGLSLSPSKEICSQTFTDITSNIKQLVSEFGSILHDASLAPFVTRVKFEYVMESEQCPFEGWEGQYIEMTSVTEDTGIEMDCSEIADLLHKNIDCVWEKAMPFMLYCSMVEECAKLNVKKSMDEIEWTSDQFKLVLAKHHEQIGAMQKLPVSVREGLMVLKIQPFRDSCLPFPLRILSDVNERLPVIAYRRNEDLLINIKDATHRLEKPCKDVSDFVQYLSFMTKLLVDLPAMEKEFGLIAKMYAVADEFDVPLPPEELALYRTLLPSFSHLKATLTYSEATKDELIKKYSKDLESQISRLLDDLKTLKDEVRHSNVLADDVSATVALQTIVSYHRTYEKYSGMAHKFMDYQARFGTTGRVETASSSYNSESTSTLLQLELSECERDIRLRKLLWENLTDWKKYMNTWSAASFHTIDVTEIQKIVKHMTQTIMLLEKALPVNNILPCLKIGVEEFKLSLPLLVSLRNPVLKARHLNAIEALTGINVIQDPLCTVAKVLESSYFEQRADIAKISIQASNEATLEGMLQKVIEIWKRTEFTLVPYRDHPDMVVLSGVDDVQIALEESLVTIATIKGSRFVDPIQDSVDEWDRRLELFSVTLDEWITCQRNWMYLESILTTPDIQRQLPREARLFSQVDKSWKELMRKVQERSNAIWAATTPGVLETLQANNANLDKILKCLEDYLETKRLVFSRFYFLSNDDILSILSNSKNPASVQSKLTKCFGNIKKLIITKEANQSACVKGLMSAEGETLDLIRVLRVRGNVEVWMGLVETAMFEVVRYTIKGALLSYNNLPYRDWWKSNSGQVIILVSQVIWNQLIEDAFYCESSDKKLDELHKMWVDKLTQLSQNVTSDLEPWQRLALESLLTIEVHARDVIKDLLEKKIENSDDFEWTRQLRYNYDDIRDTVMIRQNNSVFEYGFEYLGSTSRLVVTPLTDRCFLTLTTALHLHLGGAPGGPAGTGKTESVKDLSKGFGKQCVVFNCSEGLDFKMLARFFSGLTQSGSWCCFDEFNRIDLEVLSVVAQQLQILKRAKDAHLSRCVFEGHEIRVNPTCGFFITMNPGYAGRVELPDNLKSLFRPVAMTLPDFGLIIEVILFSEGFLLAGVLSSKLVQLYQLSSRQLSQQNHYDFGLRAIKAVLQVAGEMRRNKTMYSHIDDTTLLLQAVFDASIPKFIAEDVPLFMGIVEDLFPKFEHFKEDTLVLRTAIKDVLQEQLLLVNEAQVSKTMQLYNTMLVRHGVMQVGGTSGGKTTSRNVLAYALAKIANSQPLFNQNAPPSFNDGIKCMTLNPKCVSLEKLYGQFDKDSYEWSDGILATIIRRFAKESTPYQMDGTPSRTGASAKSRFSAKSLSRSSFNTSKSAGGATPSDEQRSLPDTPASNAKSDIVTNNWKWLVLDGPVDPVWVENLNTVLDDTRTLCLANGERVPLLPRMRILFEVDDLSYASPATISRCGMVYMDPVELGWRPFVERWKHDLPSNLPESGKKYLITLLEISVDAGLDFLKTQAGQTPIIVPDISVVRTLCSLLLAHLNIVSENGGFGDLADVVASVSNTEDPGATKNKTVLQRHPAQLPSFLSKMYLFCYIIAFGSVLEGDSDMDALEAVDSHTGLGGHTKQSLMKIWGSAPDISARCSFDLFVRDFFDLPPPYGVRLPSGTKSVFCYYFDIDTGLFAQWDTLLPLTNAYIDDVKTGFELTGGSSALANASMELDLPIPTLDSVKLARIVELLLLGNAKILLAGHAGIGKSVVLDAILKRINKRSIFDKESNEVHLYDIAGLPSCHSTLADNIQEWIKPEEEKAPEEFLFGNKKEFISAKMLMNGQTKAENIQAFFARNLNKLGRDLMGPPVGKTLVMFVEDLNMPLPEQYGAQPPLEFLRQFIGNDGFYDINRYSWKSVDDVTIAATCTVSGRVPVNIPARLLQYFSVINMPTPTQATTQHILEAKLGRYYIINSFPEEVQRTVGPLCTAGIYLYQQVMCNFKPKPSKLHYMFNMHSLRQFYLGMMSCSAADLTSQDAVVRLYAHETSRVFCDKLTTESERDKFCGYQVDSMQKYFKELATKMVFTKRHVTEARIMFSDFHIQLSSEETVKRYRIVPDYKQLIQTLTDMQNRFNVSESQDYHLVFFHDAVQHLVRLCRALRNKGLHVIQLGVGGTGRSASARLATFICGSSYHELNIRRNYTLFDLRDDLKAILLKCGSQKKMCTLFISELHILQDEFMCDIEELMGGGQIQHWFDNEEKEYIVSAMKNRQDAVSENNNSNHIWSTFISNIYQCLHIVISISPNGSNFRRYCRMHPAILSNCFIDFYSEWPEAALLAVANTFFKNNQLDKIIANTKTVATSSKGEVLNPALARAYGHLTEEERDQFKAIKEKLAPVCVQIHMQVQKMIDEYKLKANRHFHITPSSYLELLQHFVTMLKKQNRNLTVSRQRLVNGIKALNMSSSMIERMSEELIALEPQLEHKAKLTQQLMVKLENEKVSVDQTKQNVSREEAAVNRENVRIGKIAAEAESDLAAALPSLESAIAALDALDKQDISEIRVYNSPPEMVRKVMEAVCVLLKEKPNWTSAKQLLGDPGLLKRLTNFEKDNIPLKSLSRLQQYTDSPDFTPENVGKISVACKSMCMWVIAIENYAKVYRYVLPKKERFQESMEHLNAAQRQLVKKQEELAMVQEELNTLQSKYNNTRIDRDKLENRILQTKKRLDRAKVLIEALSGEKERWTDLVAGLNEAAPSLMGDTLVSTAAIVYIGPFTQTYRERLWTSWVDICLKKEISVSKKGYIPLLSAPIEIQEYYTQGLPRDHFSTENAVLLRNCHRWPLLIDPQGQGKHWLLGLEKENLTIIPYGSVHMLTDIENAIRIGTSVLIEGVPNYIDATLYPILNRRQCEQTGVVSIVDIDIEYNKDFRLYLSTSLSNPEYPPEDCIKLTIINFTVTFSGLQEQLLSRVVKMERPWLEQQKDSLLKQLFEDNLQLRELEDDILTTLSSVQTDILDDQDLVNTLDKCKKTAREIQTRVTESEQMQSKIESTRKKYLPVATRGAIIYFIISDLTLLNCMYNFSLEMFMSVFKTTVYSLGNSYLTPDQEDTVLEFNFNTANRDRQLDFKVDKHVASLVDHITMNLHKQVLCSLYSRHHLVYSVLVCVQVLRNSGVITDSEWDVFLHGGTLKLMSKSSEFVPVMEDDIATKPYQKSSGTGVTYQAKRMNRVKSKRILGKPSWLTTTQWEATNMLENTVPAFQGLSKNMIDKPEFWQAMLASDNPYYLFEQTRSRSSSVGSLKSFRADSSLEHISEDSEADPHSLSTSQLSETRPSWKWSTLTSFQKLMLIKILRMDALTESSSTFVSLTLGKHYIGSHEQSLNHIYKTSKPQNPILFILSPGVDPTTKLQRLLKDLNENVDMLEMLSLGRGQGPRIEEILRNAMQRGKWVFLQNCHLGHSWLQNLQKIVHSMQTEQIHDDFRLWLSSMPDDAIPGPVIQRSLKVAMEQPRGVKANLHQAFISGVISPGMYSDQDAGPDFRKLVYNLCLFNSVILERKKYGSLGWNISYEFTNSDLEACIQVLHQLMSEYVTVPWEALVQLAGTVMYGGRVTDKWDQRALSAILSKFFNKDAIQPGYRFTVSESYQLPEDLSIEETLSYISSLPNYDNPELFGMHQNADRTYNEHTSKELVNFLHIFQPSHQLDHGGHSNKDNIVMEFLIHIHKTLPKQIVGPPFMDVIPDMIHSSLAGSERPPSVLIEKGYLKPKRTDVRHCTPLENVIRHEVRQFNRLLNVIHVSLKTLALCLQGDEAMNEGVDEMYQNILDNKLPPAWRDNSTAENKPLSHWVELLANRINFMQYWIDLNIEGTVSNHLFGVEYSELLKEKEKDETISFQDVLKMSSAYQKSIRSDVEKLPRSFWLNALFFPQGLLTGILQTHSRKHGIPIDSLTFVHSVAPLPSRREEEDRQRAQSVGLTPAMWAFPGADAPDNGILIHGLYLDGGRWDGGNVVEALPSKQVTPLPEIHFLPKQVETERKPGMYECPIYRTSERSGTLDQSGHSDNYVTSIQLPTEHPPQHWVTRGLAIICQTVD